MNPYGTLRLYGEALEPLDREALEWQDAALCAQVDGDEWFPEKGESVLQAKRICRDCPVRVECLRYALDHDELYGVWGGLSPEDRKAVRADRVEGAGAEDIIAEDDAKFYARAEAQAEKERKYHRDRAAANRAAVASSNPQPRMTAA